MSVSEILSEITEEAVAAPVRGRCTRSPFARHDGWEGGNQGKTTMFRTISLSLSRTWNWNACQELSHVLRSSQGRVVVGWICLSVLSDIGFHNAGCENGIKMQEQIVLISASEATRRMIPHISAFLFPGLKDEDISLIKRWALEGTERSANARSSAAPLVNELIIFGRNWRCK